jgi:hypothetical protein
MFGFVPNANQWSGVSPSLAFCCIGIRTMIYEQLDEIQIGAIRTAASIVQGRGRTAHEH